MRRTKRIITILIVGAMPVARGADSVYKFYLSGPESRPPTSSQGRAFGTLTFTPPDTLRLDLSYDMLSSDLTQVIAAFGFFDVFACGQVWSGSVVGLYSGPPLPPSGICPRWTAVWCSTAA